MSAIQARVRLRPLGDSDAPALYAILSDSMHFRYTPARPLTTLASMHAFIAPYTDRLDSPGCYACPPPAEVMTHG